MFLDQKIGPFLSDETIIFNRKNVNYLQIGIEHPHSIPISEIEDLDWPIIVSINRSSETYNEDSQNYRDFVITEKDILELNLKHESVTVAVHEINNPYIIINIAYEIAN